MPTNLYGPGDNYNLVTSHVIPAMIRKIDAAKNDGLGQVVLWGTGNPRREFLYVDDMADACLHLLFDTTVCELTNIGTGTDMTIRETALAIARVVGYEGENRLRCDASGWDAAEIARHFEIAFDGMGAEDIV